MPKEKHIVNVPSQGTTRSGEGLSSCPQPASAGDHEGLVLVTLLGDLQKLLTFGVSERIKIGNRLCLPHGVDSFHSSHTALWLREPRLPFQHFQT